MTFFKKLKKGFTIVELVIVIAVIAVLAAVLIPTFTNMIKEAKVSSDTTLVKNLNTALVTDEAINGTPATMQEALDAVSGYGYSVDKLTPTSNGDIVWDSDSNRFALNNSKGESVFKDSATTSTTGIAVWKITDSLPTDSDLVYSYYLTSYSGSDITVSTGIDLSGIDTPIDVTYENKGAAQTVTLNLNGGNLTVDAPNDTVNSYGEKEAVYVEAVDSNSFYEFGIAVRFEITLGHIVFENSAVVPNVQVVGTATEFISIEINGNAAVTVVSAQDEGVAAELAKIVKVNGSAKVDIVTSSELTFDYENYAGGAGTEAYPYLIDNTTQWLNFRKSSLASEGKYWKVTSDLDFSAVTGFCDVYLFKGYIDFDGHNVSGLTTSQMATLGAGYYGGMFVWVIGDSEISNLNFTIQSPAVEYVVRPVLYVGYQKAANSDGTRTDVTFTNVNVDGYAAYTDNNASVYVYILGSNTNLTFKNCNNYATINNKPRTYTGVFLGKAYEYNSCGNNKVTFENCNNYGQIFNTSANGYSGMLISNPCGFKDNMTLDDMTVINCKNYGQIYATKGVALGCGPSSTYYKASYDQELFGSELENAASGICTTLQTSELTVDANGNYEFEAVSGAVRYELILSFWVENDTVWGTHSIAFEIDSSSLSSFSFKANNFVAYDSATMAGNMEEHTWGNTVYYSYNGNYVLYSKTNTSFPWGNVTNDIRSTYSASFIAYDADGNILSIAIPQ